MRILALAAVLLAAAPIATAAEAQPGWHHGGPRHGWHRPHRCRTVWRHHHRVRRCW